mgnify:CR=1 FL=1
MYENENSGMYGGIPMGGGTLEDKSMHEQIMEMSKEIEGIHSMIDELREIIYSLRDAHRHPNPLPGLDIGNNSFKV